MERLRGDFEKIFALFCDESNLMPQINIVKALRSAGYVVEDSFGDCCTKSHIPLEEFVDFIYKAQVHGLSKEKIEEAFRFYDPDETGYIKASEFKRILSTGPNGLSESDVSIVLETFPPNDQGMICYTLPISYVFEDIK
ncbi:uncharacterized protein VICG_02058 [Vittaforma corneae ATCC 50505]|uniref:EF-hand domain-containing protein n=1 Tax=Vittaforma corneae (strain ATCC 50505) TaxID=993615 RepID=L2GJ61_VITCO|nr:uncharacterized protein VICG_02058 [Vittaforma corneae ATCC 50505]ELA40918.1 hypothetical protein VICG_02058 [Vittaforma corneae ATCC 50505]